MAAYRPASALRMMWCAVLLVATGFLQSVHGHLYMMTPVSRNLWGTTAFNDPSYEYINYCPHCYQSRGPAIIRARAESLTDPAVLAMYGNGAWPLLTAYERGEVAANGNYLESDAISVRHGICGDPEQTAEEGSNRYGRANTNYPILETYAEGSILEVKIVVSTSHMLPTLSTQRRTYGNPPKVEPPKGLSATYQFRFLSRSTVDRNKGHLELFLCNTADMDDPDGVVNQECFNMHPLDRAEDDGVASPIDPNYPGRYYLDPTCRASETDQTLLPGAFPGEVATARYKLPSSVTCSRCIIQMAYYTGNSCMHPGYDEFNPDSWPSECAPTKEDWIETGLGMCGDGDNYPEEYWNCADIEITADGSPSNPAPAPAPVSESISELETPAPAYDESTMLETPSPVDAEPIMLESPAPVEMETSKPDTPAPVYETSEPETPAPDATIMPEAPVVDDTSEPETPSPTPREAEPFNEQLVITLPPATFAPSVVATEMPPDECDDPVAAYGQCGGDSYEGSTCCRPGYECTAVASCYSECRPISEDACSEGWGQCGGRNWEGPTCCWSGAECLERNEWYSQCVPETRV